jgi:polo-like kinase 1
MELDEFSKVSEITETVTRVDRSQYSRVYKKLRLLGKGGFAVCYEVEEEETGKEYALKILNKEMLTRYKGRRKLLQEIKIHKTLHHENVVYFYRVFEDGSYIYILLELCETSLAEISKARKRLSLPETQYYVQQVARGTAYLHQYQILHRDLKLGNIFLNGRVEVKIGDFGLACRLEFKTDKRRSICGTPNYLSPEMVNPGFGHSYPVDVWAIGVIAYCLLVGRPPFETRSIFDTYKRIRDLHYYLPESIDEHPHAREFIQHILVLDPVARPTVDQLLAHPFLKDTPCWLPSACLDRQFIVIPD